MSWESSDVVRFDLGPLLLGQMRIPKLKSAYILLIIGPRGLQCKPTCRKTWDGNLMIIFDLGPLLQGQTRIDKPKSAYN